MSKVIPRPKARKYDWESLRIKGVRYFKAKSAAGAERLRSTILVSAAHHRRFWNRKFEITTNVDGREVMVWRVR